MNTNLFLQDNPNLVPRDQVRLERIAATPHPDRRRVKVEVDVTPFRERPNLEIAILSGDGQIASSASVLATMHFKMEFNLHLRGASDPAGNYTLRVQLYYDDAQSPQDVREIALPVPRAGAAGEGGSA
jgi:hypothetical protein